MRYEVVIFVSFVLTFYLQNNQGNSNGSLFWKISDDMCLHIHHWVIAFILVVLVSSCAGFKHRDVIISSLIGFGLAGFFAYSDRFSFIEPCSIPKV